MDIDLNVCDKKNERTIKNRPEECISIIDQIVFFKQENDQTQEAEKQIKNNIPDPEVKIGESHSSKIHVKNHNLRID